MVVVTVRNRLPVVIMLVIFIKFLTNCDTVTCVIVLCTPNVGDLI
jgi:hypothetical protein